MKKLKLIALIMAASLVLGFSPRWHQGTLYTPILLLADDLPRSVFNQSVKEFQLPGKIYLYNETVFIVDTYSGVHVIDNSNPSQPAKIGFIHIPGILDVAIKDNVMFADNATDLVSICIEHYPEIEVLDRKPAVFPEPPPPDLTTIPHIYRKENRPHNTVIVGWTELD